MKNSPSKRTSKRSKRGLTVKGDTGVRIRAAQTVRSRTRSPIGRELVARLARFTDALQKTDKIEDQFTCRTVRLNVEPRKYTPQLVKQARRRLNASQRVFASFLGVSVSTVRDWEQGLKPPRGVACRMMDEIRRDPDYWLARLRELALSS